MKKRTYKKTLKRFEERTGCDINKMTDSTWLRRETRRGRAIALRTRLYKELYNVMEYYYSRYYG